MEVKRKKNSAKIVIFFIKLYFIIKTDKSKIKVLAKITILSLWGPVPVEKSREIR